MPVRMIYTETVTLKNIVSFKLIKAMQSTYTVYTMYTNTQLHIYQAMLKASLPNCMQSYLLKQ